ncbi:MAG: phosphoenolpyruvate--protein phosphotransferase [Desulfobacterales bacterium]|jgi:phosphotransferase system enzyme I (PtsP)|nr:phosphoenolpyruvate--protein phosphotransferase [Desulfobacterales bacterium]
MATGRARIVDDIFKAIAQTRHPEKTLKQVVRLISDHLKTDVCSVYVYDPSNNRLALRETLGLSKRSVGAIEMDVSEGLTGLVIERMAPVFVVDPKTHPRFKYYANSGEEKFQTFLGLPLIYHQKVLGALVVQTISLEGITESDIPVFSNIAGQVAALIAYMGLLSEVSDKKDSTDILNSAASRTITKQQSDDRNGFLRGESIMDRLAEGYARFLPEHIDFDQIHMVAAAEPDIEEKRIHTAIKEAAEQIKRLALRGKEMSGQESAVIETHLMMLTDRSLKRKIIDRIRKGVIAEYALKKAVLEYAEKFSAMQDAYLKERATDILDIGRRVLAHLKGASEDPHEAFSRPTILIASDISPVDLLAIRQPNLKGIALTRGGKTSHTVILARSMEIPVVIGVERLLDIVRENDYLIVDGASGIVFVNPEPGIRAKYARRRGQHEKMQQELSLLRESEAVTLDGLRVRLGANIGLLSDVTLVKKYGADHIGLYRTEFPFLLRKTFPSEEEQTALYQKILSKAEGLSVTIRTFDVGGDKFLSYMAYPKEENPFLGWRSIRISLELENEFRTQIRSILRASSSGKTRMLFPMITSVEETRQVVSLVDIEKRILSRQGIPYDHEIKLGIMVEVPGTVPILHHILNYVDFISIGTNDLIQYLLAVDRNNQKVARLYNALHPSVIAVIDDIIRICKQQSKPVSICGEAASRLDCILLYIGMGADQISMTPSAVPAAKQFIRGIRKSEAEKTLKTVMEMEDAFDISKFLNKKVNK